MDLSHATKTVYSVSQRRTVYRAILSVGDATAMKHGLYERSNYETLLSRHIETIRKVNHIKAEDFFWCAAMHKEAGHPHVHILFWDHGDQPRQDQIPKPIFNKMMSEVRADFSRELNLDEIQKAQTEQGESAKTARLAMQALLQDANPGKALNLKKFLTGDRIEGLSEKMLELVRDMPARGSLRYAYLPPAFKTQVNQFIDACLEVPELAKQAEAYTTQTRKISELYSNGERESKENLEKAQRKLRKELANEILSSLKEIRSEIRAEVPRNLFDLQNFSHAVVLNVVQPTEKYQKLLSSLLDEDQFFEQVNGIMKDTLEDTRIKIRLQLYALKDSGFVLEEMPKARIVEGRQLDEDEWKLYGDATKRIRTGLETELLRQIQMLFEPTALPDGTEVPVKDLPPLAENLPEGLRMFAASLLEPHKDALLAEAAAIAEAEAEEYDALVWSNDQDLQDDDDQIPPEEQLFIDAHLGRSDTGEETSQPEAMPTEPETDEAPSDGGEPEEKKAKTKKLVPEEIVDTLLQSDSAKAWIQSSALEQAEIDLETKPSAHTFEGRAFTDEQWDIYQQYYADAKRVLRTEIIRKARAEAPKDLRDLQDFAQAVVRNIVKPSEAYNKLLSLLPRERVPIGYMEQGIKGYHDQLNRIMQETLNDNRIRLRLQTYALKDSGIDPEKLPDSREVVGKQLDEGEWAQYRKVSATLTSRLKTELLYQLKTSALQQEQVSAPEDTLGDIRAFASTLLHGSQEEAAAEKDPEEIVSTLLRSKQAQAWIRLSALGEADIDLVDKPNAHTFEGKAMNDEQWDAYQQSYKDAKKVLRAEITQQAREDATWHREAVHTGIGSMLFNMVFSVAQMASQLAAQEQVQNNNQKRRKRDLAKEAKRKKEAPKMEQS